jgi:DNA-binding beta-propeller fold protein YncE
VLSASGRLPSATAQASSARDASSDVLSVLDASAFPPRIVAEIPIRHFAVGPPAGVALTPDERLALVSVTAVPERTPGAALRPPAYVQVIDLDVTPPRETTKVPLASPPMSISINRAGDLALVAHADGLVSVLKVAGKIVTAVGSVKVGDAGSDVCHVAISPDGRWALATKRAEGTVAVLAIEDDSVRYTGRDVTAGARPCMVDIASTGRVGVVANEGRRQGDADTLTLIDMTRAPLRAVATVSVGPTPEGVAISPDGRWLAVTLVNGATASPDGPFHSDAGKVVLFSLGRGEATRVAEADAGHEVRGVAFTPDGKYVLVQDGVEQDLAVYGVSPTALEDTGVRIKVKGSPVSIRVAPR